VLNKSDHIKYWKQTAEDSWGTATYLYTGKKFSEAIFLFCSAIKKLKAHWVKR
jgi:hypothetical protein